MRPRLLSAVTALLASALAFISPSTAQNASDLRISGPAVHENLAVYLIHGPSRGGPIPLTLQEALEQKRIEVREIGQVNTLEIENTGDLDVFVQTGDIVKGGQQDRVLTSSLILPPHSGAVAIDSFCVEQGRWSQRGAEDVHRFESAAATLPSRAARLALAAASAPKADPDRHVMSDPQARVWREVAAIQDKLSRSLAAPVAAPDSRTSLQLSLENGKLQQAEEVYLRALTPLGDSETDVVGYAVAINDKVASADIYPSNGLFRKLWPKLLRASVAEAIGERPSATASEPPRLQAVETFLGDAQRAEGVRKSLPARNSLEIRESDRVIFQEARPAAAPAVPAKPDVWAHRSYLAK
jgi:hypothetical protein